MNQNNMSLEDTWKYCLEMWKWISDQILIARKQKDFVLDCFYVDELKEQWLKDHEFEKITSDCFFCDYAGKHLDINKHFCTKCPASICQSLFDCEKKEYDYYNKPIKFYNKLVELNVKRLERIKDETNTRVI